MSDKLEIRDYALYGSELCCRRNFDKGERVLVNITFSFEKKGVHGILAPSGSGKSLLMDIIAGCETADSGELFLYGEPIGKNTVEYKNKIGYVPESITFYPNMTATEILNFVGEARRVDQGRLYRQIKEALELVGLDSLKNRLVRNLTAFELKKLAIAASLLGNPEIILLDATVTARMNAERRAELMGLIQMLGRMKTVILATDDYKIARELCDGVLIMSDGQLLAMGSFEELETRLKGADDSSTLESLYNSLARASNSKAI